MFQIILFKKNIEIKIKITIINIEIITKTKIILKMIM